MVIYFFSFLQIWNEADKNYTFRNLFWGEEISKCIFRSTYMLLSIFLFCGSFVVLKNNLLLLPLVHPRRIEENVGQVGYCKIELILKQIKKRANANFIAIYAKENNIEKDASVYILSDMETSATEKWYEVQDQDALILSVLQQGKIVTEREISQKPSFLGEEIKQYMGIPIFFNNAPIGCLALGWIFPRRASIENYLAVFSHILAPRIAYLRATMMARNYEKELEEIRQNLHQKMETIQDTPEVTIVNIQKILSDAKQNLLQKTEEVLGSEDTCLQIDLRLHREKIFLSEEKPQYEYYIPLVCNEIQIGSLQANHREGKPHFLVKEKKISYLSENENAQILHLLCEKLGYMLLYLENLEADAILTYLSQCLNKSSNQDLWWNCIQDVAKQIEVSVNISEQDKTENIVNKKYIHTKKVICYKNGYWNIQLQLEEKKYLNLTPILWQDLQIDRKNPWFIFWKKFQNIVYESLQHIRLQENAYFFRAAIAILVKKHRLSSSITSMKETLDLMGTEIKKQKEKFPEEDFKKTVSFLEKCDEELKKMDDILQFMDKEEYKNSCRLDAILGVVRRYFDREPVNIQYDPKVNDYLHIAPDILVDMFCELVQNAIKANKCGNRMSRLNIRIIKVNSDEKFCYVRFEDDGIGIPQEIRCKIFKERIPMSEEHGRGLFQLKEYLNNSGGDIALLDEKGSKFFITLPLCKASE